jgi:uncharacterized membrane protein
MPNWTYLTLHFLHTLALGLWIGGSVALGSLTAPAVFGLVPDRSLAGRIMARVFRRFDRILLLCAATLIVTSAVMMALYGRMSQWYAIEYVCIGMMSASLLYTTVLVSPRIRRLRREGKTEGSAFERLHRTSELAMQFNLVCAIVALLFS